MASIPQQYRDALQTWVSNHIHKAVHTATWYERDPESTEETPLPDIEMTEDYLDIQELAYRLGRKIWKAAPELRGKYELQDIEELLDDKLVLLLSLAGVTKTGSGPRRYTDYVDEDPDV